MRSVKIFKTEGLEGVVDDVASDKSISHRCAMFSLLSDKPSTIKSYLRAEDTLNTLEICRSLGAKAHFEDEMLYIEPPKNINEPDDVLYCGNSGTTMRLFCGFLASIEGFFVLSGDKYLRKRPMKRVTNPLRQIGAKIDGRKDGDLAPLAIRGGGLKSFEYDSPIASAQVKSALILAALKCNEKSYFSEPELSRDHTENMLNGMGANIKESDGKIEITPLSTPLEPLVFDVPSDPSSAFFLAVACAILPGSKLVIKNMLLNPTRVEAFKILQSAGVDIEYKEVSKKYESIGDVYIESRGELKPVSVSENISWLIDEIPALSIVMACAKGVSSVRNAKELRVKESDRIKSTITNLNRCGIETVEYEDGFDVVGGTLKEAFIESMGDHRIAMSFAIAGLKCGMEIDDTECIDTSFPNFFAIIKKLGVRVEGV